MNTASVSHSLLCHICWECDPLTLLSQFFHPKGQKNVLSSALKVKYSDSQTLTCIFASCPGSLSVFLTVSYIFFLWECISLLLHTYNFKWNDFHWHQPTPVAGVQGFIWVCHTQAVSTFLLTQIFSLEPLLCSYSCSLPTPQHLVCSILSSNNPQIFQNMFPFPGISTYSFSPNNVFPWRFAELINMCWPSEFPTGI